MRVLLALVAIGCFAVPAAARAATPFVYDRELGDVARATLAQAVNAANVTDLQKQLPGDCKDFGRGCGYNNFWLDRGSQVVAIDGEKRTSLLIDPPNGKIPPLTAERQKFMAARPRQSFDGPEARPLGERCAGEDGRHRGRQVRYRGAVERGDR